MRLGLLSRFFRKNPIFLGGRAMVTFTILFSRFPMLCCTYIAPVIWLTYGFFKKGGTAVKIVYAATEEQMDKIAELVRHMFTEVFPDYFTDEEITAFQRDRVLALPDDPTEQIGTLKAGYQMIASLQTIISILETEENKRDEHYAGLFEFNKFTLEQFGLHFPFSFSHFQKKHTDTFSMFKKAANRLLV
jgi:hypothetical protein